MFRKEKMFAIAFDVRVERICRKIVFRLSFIIKITPSTESEATNVASFEK